MQKVDNIFNIHTIIHIPSFPNQKLKNSVLVLLSVLVLSLSCVKQGGGILGSGEKGSITFICGGGDDYYETKTTLNGLTTHWIENSDRVGLFSLQACVEPGGVPGIANLPLTAVTSGERALFPYRCPEFKLRVRVTMLSILPLLIFWFQNPQWQNTREYQVVVLQSL